MTQKTPLFLFIFLIFISLSLPICSVARAVPQTSENNYSALMETANITAVRQHVEFLGSLRTRATGYAGNEVAAQYVYDMFKNYCRLENVSLHEFSAVDAVSHAGNITVSGTVIELHPLLPNFVCPSTTPPEGITGRLIRADEGYQSFDGQEVEGSIVLRPWKADWKEAARLGAKAVIFLPPTHILTSTVQSPYDQDKAPSIDPINFPRFYVEKAGADWLMKHLGEEARVVATQTWENVTGRNVMGFVRGRDYPDKYIMLTSYYDSYSVTPSIAPGAQEACGVAALIELAKYLHDNPPRYSVVIIAFGGHHQALAGSVKFYDDYITEFAHVDNLHTNPFKDPAKQPIGDNIYYHINLDLSTGAEATYLTSAGGLWGHCGLGDIGQYLEDLYEEFKATPEGQKFEARFGYTSDAPRLWGTSVHIEVQPWKGFPFDHEPSAYSMHGGTFTTAYDSRPYFMEPFDTLEKINFSNLQNQLELIHTLLIPLLNEDDEVVWDWVRETFPHPNNNPYSMWRRVKGRVAFWSEEKAWYEPVPNALVYLDMGCRYRNPTYWHQRFTFADELGYFEFEGGCPSVESGKLSAWVINSTTGNIVYAPDHGRYQYASPSIYVLRDKYPQTVVGDTHQEVGIVAVFKASTLVLFDTVLPNSLYLPMTELGGVIQPSLSLYEFPTFAPLISSSIWGNRLVRVLAVPPDIPIQIMWKFPIERYPRGYLMNSSSEYPDGRGYTLKAGEQKILTMTSLRYVEDLYYLNNKRFEILRPHKPDLPEIETYQQHLQAELLIDMAREALNSHQYTQADNYIAQAWRFSQEAYVFARQWTEDAATAVPFISLFLLPFAFVAEKLLFGWSGSKRIVSFLGISFFIVVIFNLLHPGFQLAASPPMILIGFSVLVLSAPVLVIVFRNTGSFMKDIRIKRLGKHEAEISRVSEIGHAFITGVEHMRRMKLRSVLTLTSLILMVAALCSLTSISAFYVTQTTSWPGAPQYNGVYIRRYMWGWGTYTLPDSLLDALKMRYRDQAVIAPRAWKYMPGGYRTFRDTEELGFRTTYNGKSIITPVMWGLTPEEKNIGLHQFLNMGRWFEPYDRSAVILNIEQAKRLGIDATEPYQPVNVTFEGIKYRVIGIINMELDYFRDLDGERITPVQFDVEPPNMWDVHLELDRCIIMRYEDVLYLGGSMAAIWMKFENQALVDAAAHEVYDAFNGYEVYSCVEEDVYLHTSRLTVTAWGLENQAVPLAIVMLATFNIVLGSVYERKRDIAIYGTVGLSPLHIAVMFLAESTVYALLGGVVGYLVAILEGKIIMMFIPGVVVNYSSGLVIIAMGGAMATVLVASLYPILVASRLVTPSLERVWKMSTEPMGNVWEIPLPFTAKREETGGITLYIMEYAKSHQMMDAPDFSTSNIKASRGERAGKPYTGFSMNVRLFPYDMGITHKMEFYLFQAKLGRWESRVVLRRTGGSMKDWIRLSKRFVDTLRKQLLLWRTMPPDEKNQYIKRFKEEGA